MYYMTEPPINDHVFIKKLAEIVQTNLKNEHFGIKELAYESGLSQKGFRKKLKKYSNKTVNQFIRESRLEKAHEMLKDAGLTASEIAFKVGFSSPAYFNKCFHEYFGYTPGKVAKSDQDNSDQNLGIKSGIEIRKRKPVWKTYFLSVSGIILLALSLGVIGLLLYKKLNKPKLTSNLISSDGRISIAVMPFQNRTNDTIWDIWQNGIQNEVVAFLSNYAELKVKQAESINGLLKSQGIKSYASITPSFARSISKQLGASTFVYGTIIKAGTYLHVTAELTDSRTKEVYRSFQIERPAKEEFIFQIIDSFSVQLKNFLLLTVLEKDLLPENRYLTFARSPEAYRYYADGLKAFLREDFTGAIDLYSRALAVDSNCLFAASDMSYAYGALGKSDQKRKWVLWIYGKRNSMTPIQKNFTEFTYENNFGTPEKALRCLIRVQEYDPEANYHYLLGLQYLNLNQISQAVIELEKNLEMYTRLNPSQAIDWDYEALGWAYHKAGRLKDEKKLYKEALNLFPESPELNYRQAVLILTEGDTAASNRNVGKYRSLLKVGATTEADIATKLAELYSESSYQEKAEAYYRIALSLEPDNTGKIRDLSYFLIDKERNIDEGLALADSVLRAEPDDYIFMHIKGWGLYKNGRQQEALELLQKSWDLRMQKSVYDRMVYLQIEEVKKAGSNSK
jgi:AraC-like DNA-binding protein/TolB-like protein/Tfp pilus assembly protein PilF